MRKQPVIHQIDGLIALLLFGVFSVCILAVLLTGADALVFDQGDGYVTRIYCHNGYSQIFSFRGSLSYPQSMYYSRRSSRVHTA